MLPFFGYSLAYVTEGAELYPKPDPTPGYALTFTQRDKDYVMDAIDSTFVSSVGEYVNRFEQYLAAFTGAARAVATVDGTCALQTELTLMWVKTNDEVITLPGPTYPQPAI